MKKFLKFTLFVSVGIAVIVGGKEKLMKILGGNSKPNRFPGRRGVGQPGCRSGETSVKKPNDDLAQAKKRYKDIIYLIDNPAIDSTKRFGTRFAECLQVWKDIRQLAALEERANILLTSYYAEDKLKSKLSGFCEYVEKELEEEQSSESVVLCGFNTCLNLAWLDYQKMKEKLKEIPADSGTSPSESDRWDFLQDMSYRGGAFSDLYKALSLGRSRFDLHETVAVSDQELLSILTKVKSYIDDTSAGYFAWDSVMDDLNKMKEKRNQTIENASHLEECLDKVMTEDRISRMKDKECPVEQLKALYREMDKIIKETLPDIEV
ncbi:hypothetical protein C0033_13235 [Clostridium sp. chh4-2]|uniref:hypothetical protein n=1 Tax=Clostridium sp. chh4-2 TaxID=2067550 RepID=UPI000CCF3DC2|nr:hypothetical protein [Clostridium sp. chh4-2]PNV61541.1 hypothetical protein C0033_13235 [Clostridium sp. chh4-2]